LWATLYITQPPVVEDRWCSRQNVEYSSLTVRSASPMEHPGLTHTTMVSEETAYLNYAFENTSATVLSCAYPLYRYAAPEVRKRFLPGILDGRQIGAIALTDSGAGSDTSGMQTWVEFDETREEWVISGFKTWPSP